MGFLVGSDCFEQLADAENHLYSGQPLLITQGGFRRLEKTESGWSLNEYQTGATAPVLLSGTQMVTALPECSNRDNVIDGMALGWAVVTPMFIAVGFLYLKRAARS